MCLRADKIAHRVNDRAKLRVFLAGDCYQALDNMRVIAKDDVHTPVNHKVRHFDLTVGQLGRSLFAPVCVRNNDVCLFSGFLDLFFDE